MLRKTMGTAAIVAATMLCAGFAAAQTPRPRSRRPTRRRFGPTSTRPLETLRKDARAGKADILGKTMALDSKQAAAFWPVYKQYEAEARSCSATSAWASSRTWPSTSTA